MKRILFVMLLALCASSVSGNDLNVRLVDTILAADTAADIAWEKTVYTPKYNISAWCHLGFYWKISTAYGNTAGASDEDSIDVNFQMSHNGYDNWITYLVDSGAVAIDSGRTALHFSCIDSVMGNWGRGVFRYRDSTASDTPDSLGNIRAIDFEFWLLGRK